MAKKIQQTISEGRNSNRVKLGLDRVKLFSWYKTTQKTLNVYKKIYEKTIK
jgi:hypothetical protein